MPKLALDDSKRMLHLGAHTDLDLLNALLDRVNVTLASAPDKLRTSAWQTNAKGQRKRFTRAAVTRKPKGVQLKPLERLAFDTVIRQREGIKRYILTAIACVTHRIPA